MNVMPAAAGPGAGLPEAVTHLGIRPEHITLAPAGSGDLQGKVDVLEYLGADTFVIMDCGAAGQITVRVNGDVDLVPGDAAGLVFQPDKRHGFGADGQAIALAR